MTEVKKYKKLQQVNNIINLTGKLLCKNVQRDLMDAHGEIVSWNQHTCFYGYDKDCNLAGIISENRLPDMNKVCEYIPVENGAFGTPKPIQSHTLYTIVQNGSPKEAEYFELWRQSSKPA